MKSQRLAKLSSPSTKIFVPVIRFPVPALISYLSLAGFLLTRDLTPDNTNRYYHILFLSDFFLCYYSRIKFKKRQRMNSLIDSVFCSDPFTGYRNITGCAIREGEVRVTSGVGVPKIIHTIPVHANGIDTIAVPITGHRNVPG